jgi:hypothetical protein
MKADDRPLILHPSSFVGVALGVVGASWGRSARHRSIAAGVAGERVRVDGVKGCRGVCSLAAIGLRQSSWRR